LRLGACQYVSTGSFDRVDALSQHFITEDLRGTAFTIDKQPFHHIPEGLPAFERRPG
jgi:hypothetical protein